MNLSSTENAAIHDAEVRLRVGDGLFVEALEAMYLKVGRPILAGLCGPQGSGKSTTAQRIVDRLTGHGRKAVVCSIDDFYRTQTERQSLAANVHPLLAVRGVPGTHDIALLMRTLAGLLDPTSTTSVPLCQFDKAADERLPQEHWPATLPAEIVILEGWCIGCRPQPDEALGRPVNNLEALEDANRDWRRFVNKQLTMDYAELFATLDLKLMLRPPSFECVHAWREEQEACLPRTAQNARPPMTATDLSRFIAHYERLSRWIMEDEPADLIADLDHRRLPVRWRWRLGAACPPDAPDAN